MLPFCSGPILITSCLHRKDTRLSLWYIFVLWESLGTRLNGRSIGTKSQIQSGFHQEGKDTVQAVNYSKFASICYMTRGSHLFVPCRSVCDWDPSYQSPFWEPIKGSTHGCNLTFDLGSKLSKPFLRADQGINNARLQSDLWPVKIKQSRALEGTI